MFCKKCGKQLKDGAQFCVYCGTKVVMPGQFVQAEASDIPVQKPEPVEAPVSKPEVAEEPLPEIELVEPSVYDSKPAEVSEQEEEYEQETSRNRLPLIIAGIAIVVVIAVALGYFFLSGRSDESEEDPESSVSQEEAEPEEHTLDDASESDTEDNVPAPEPEEVVEEPEATEEEPVEEVSEEGVHTYELIVSDATWSQAYEDCIARGGHLVRINSDEEYQAILQQISAEDKNNIKFWIGGTRGSEDSYEYHWAYEDGSYGDEVLNEDEKYSSYWLDGEPSYEDETVDSQEMYMNIFYMKRDDRWVWNDAPDDLIAVVSNYAGTVGYICEYEN